MYLRISKVRRGQKVYQYVQLVESFRTKGVKSPTNRVLANLGTLEDLEIENLRAALEASRAGKVLTAPVEAHAGIPRPKAQVHANLRYLDLAVLLRVWRELGLDRLIEDAAGAGDRTVPASQVITALVLQRCVAPGSKLAAERWYPKTALPELQGISVDSFNNSRVHRSLEALDRAEANVQAALPSLVRDRQGAFTALFIDATDTWFVGQGPPIASKGRDKEGIYRRRVGLVMLCDQRGYPLRWKTLDGRYHDPTALAEMAAEAGTLPWTKGIPIVMDRAMGHAGATQQLHDSDMHYVTGLPDPELMSSGAPIPWETLDALQCETSIAGVEALLVGAGFSTSPAGRLVLDLGVFQKARSAASSHVSIAVASVRMIEAIEANKSSTELAARLKTTRRTISRHLPLSTLSAEVRTRILSESIDRLTLSDLTGVARLPAEEQPAALESLLAEPGRTRHTSRKVVATRYPARGALSIGPHRFLEDRRKDLEHVAAVERLVDDVNQRLGHRSNRRTDGSALAEVERCIRSFGLGSVLSVSITGTAQGRKVALERNDAAWAHRRRGDGINVVISHPEVAGTAEELIRQYFAKDAIEKDFQTIKSLIEIRPIHHRTDLKVRAHVTICVLALLLVRVLDEKLGSYSTAAAALETLEKVRLNLVVEGKSAFHTVTRPDPEVVDLLEKLSLTELTDDLKVMGALTPR